MPSRTPQKTTESTPTESANFANHGDPCTDCCCSQNGGSGMTFASRRKRRHSSRISTSPWNGLRLLPGRLVFGAPIVVSPLDGLSVHLGVFSLDHCPEGPPFRSHNGVNARSCYRGCCR